MNRQQKLVLTVAIMASFVGALDAFIVNVALPAISKDLGGGLALQQWVVDAYMITLGSLILVAGSFSDIFGRRRVLASGLVWFCLASLLCAIAPSGSFLVAARALQGIGGALLIPSSLAIIISYFSGPLQGRAIGIWTAWFSVAAVAGPLLGGILVTYTSWRWIFAVNVLPTALVIWGLSKIDMAEKPSKDVRVDWAGAALCAVGLAGLVYGLIEQPSHGWGSPLILTALIGGGLSLLLFVYWETKARQPMLPLSLFKVRNFSVGNLATLVFYGGLVMATFLIVIVLQQVVGYSALKAGLAMVPVTVVMFFLSSRFGTLAGKYGPRWFMAAGPLIAAAGFLLMVRTRPEFNYFTQLLPGVLVFALGLAATVAPLTAAILGGVEPRHAGIASAVNNAVSRVAGLITVAFIGLITGAHLDMPGFHRVLLVTAILLACGGIISAVGIQNAAKPAKIDV
jgi:EmrB/QacA subfamily drug resistance transporter